MRALVIAHDHLGDAGLVGEALRARGIDLHTHLVVPADRFATPDVRTAFPDPSGYDLVVPLGAPWSAYDDARVGSWVRPELDYLRDLDTRGVPVLGVCFGGQLLARAHGGRVLAAERPEIGWTDVAGTPGTIGDGPWFEWHFDRWELPPGAVELARTPAASQAFVLRRNLAVQFHPEVTAPVVAGWLANGGRRAAEAHGVDVDALLARTAEERPAAARRARDLVDAFLRQVAAA